jgi:hypothetical protein
MKANIHIQNHNGLIEIVSPTLFISRLKLLRKKKGTKRPKKFINIPAAKRLYVGSQKAARSIIGLPFGFISFDVG